MNRYIVVFGRLLIAAAIVLSFGVTRPGAAEGLNSLTFSFDVCPESGVDCQAYANTDARIVELATGAEQSTTTNDLGWASFDGLVDGDYAFSTPILVQVSITFNCADESGAVVPSWLSDDGPTVTLAGGHDVACAGTMVQTGRDGDEEEAGAAPAGSASLRVYTFECPAGQAIGDHTNCGNPADASIYTAYVHYGTVPFSTTLESDLNDYGYASFDGLAADHYSVMVGTDSTYADSASCRIFDASGSGEGTDIVPNLGGSGYELDLIEGGDADCYFYMIPASDEVADAEVADTTVGQAVGAAVLLLVTIAVEELTAP